MLECECGNLRLMTFVSWYNRRGHGLDVNIRDDALIIVKVVLRHREVVGYVPPVDKVLGVKNWLSGRRGAIILTLWKLPIDLMHEKHWKCLLSF